LSLTPRSNAPHRNNGGRPPTRFTSPVRRVRYSPSPRNSDSRRSRLSRTKAWESDRSPGSLGWRGKPSVVSTMRAVSMNYWGRPGPASPLCPACSPSTCMSVSTTDAPPLLHFTKNFKHWDIAAATARSATTRDRFVPSALRQPESRYRRSGGLPHGCYGTEDSLTDDEQIGRGQVLASRPHLEATAGYVTSFAEMLTERLGKQLNSWMAAVSTDDHPALVSLRLRARHRSRSGQERADAALQFRSGRRACQSDQDAQTANVRTRRIRPAPQTNTPQ
jgi:hypothetical protein